MPPPLNAPRLEPLKPVLLCIDDNELLLQCYKGFLGAFGFEVLTASGGRKGLELASLSPVDLVLLDYQMPDVDGSRVAAELKRMRPGTPIILLSGLADIPAQMLELVDNFVPKDETDKLLPAVAELIGMPKVPPRRAKPACGITALAKDASRTAS